MNLRRLLARAATAAIALGVFAFSPTAALAQGTPGAAYVALGDSYTSGLGAGRYDAASGDCRRSAVAHPQLWADANDPASFTFAACSGAGTADVLGEQLGALSAATTLVSLTVGGVDAGFSDTLTTCVLKGTRACVARVAEANDYIERTLPGLLDEVYTGVREAAPHAHVVVVGYPRLYHLRGSCPFGLSERSRAALNGAADTLSDVTSKRAADHGFAYGDARPAFTGHEICSGDSWLHSVTLPLEESYHPTAEGQSGGYYAVLEKLA